MTIVRFRNKEEHQDLLKTVKKMKKELDEVQECLEDAVEDTEYRRGYHREYDDDDMRRERYNYRDRM